MNEQNEKNGKTEKTEIEGSNKTNGSDIVEKIKAVFFRIQKEALFYCGKIAKKQHFGLNRQAKAQQIRTLIIIGVSVLAVIFIAVHVASPSHSKKESAVKSSVQTPDMTGVLSADFTAKDNASALSAQQADVDRLTKQVEQLSNTLNNSATAKEDQEISDLRAELDQLKKEKEDNIGKQPVPANGRAAYSGSVPIPAGASGNLSNLNPNLSNSPTVGGNLPGGMSSVGVGIETIAFSYNDANGNAAAVPKNPDNFIPAGTFARAVLLGGADANASVNAQGDTTPILIRILDQGTLPNGRHSHLKGCFLLASTYGDISSERAMVRLTHLSCVNPADNSILSFPVKGTVFGPGGHNGIMGNPVMRNGSILWYAGISGLFSGLGSAMQQAQTTQSISPLGSTSTVDNSNILSYGAYGGASTALSKLADYYIKRADQYHPIIEIGAGSQVDVVFEEDIDLSSEQTTPASNATASSNISSTAASSTNSSAPLNQLPQNVLAQMQAAHLGDNVPANH